jgi:aspartate 1-decarboxylase
VRPGDLAIVAAYVALEPAEIAAHRATVVQVDAANQPTAITVQGGKKP